MDSFRKGFIKQAQAKGIPVRNAEILYKNAGLRDWVNEKVTNIQDWGKTNWAELQDNRLSHAYRTWKGVTNNGSTINPFAMNWDKLPDFYRQSQQDALANKANAYTTQFQHRLGQGDMNFATQARNKAIDNAAMVTDPNVHRNIAGKITSTQNEFQQGYNQNMQNAYNIQQSQQQMKSLANRGPILPYKPVSQPNQQYTAPSNYMPVKPKNLGFHPLD